MSIKIGTASVLPPFNLVVLFSSRNSQNKGRVNIKGLRYDTDTDLTTPQPLVARKNRQNCRLVLGSNGGRLWLPNALSVALPLLSDFLNSPAVHKIAGLFGLHSSQSHTQNNKYSTN